MLVPFVSLCKPAFTICFMSVLFLVQGEYTCKKKNRTVIGMFKYYLAQGSQTLVYQGPLNCHKLDQEGIPICYDYFPGSPI